MITLKQLKEEILTYDVVHYPDEEDNIIECVEVTLTDRIIDLYMDTKELNIGIIAKKILEDGLYIELSEAVQEEQESTEAHEV